MRILVRMPNWLGDAVMATPALGNLMHHFPDAQVVLVGSAAVAELFRHDPSLLAVVADPSRRSHFRLAGIFRAARHLRQRYGPFHLAVAFPNSLSSRLLVRLCGAPRQAAAHRGVSGLLLSHPIRIDGSRHQAEIYNQIVCGLLSKDFETGPTRLFVPRIHDYGTKTLGINPGAAYGSAKRWKPEGFAEVAAQLAQADGFGVVIFGSAAEADIAGQIETLLARRGITCRNVAGRTSLPELASMIAGLDLLVTNDSGPMHIAGALRIATVAIFGSTNHRQTCQWRNSRMKIVRLALPCAPCMKRTCPLGHHACMQQLEAGSVLIAARELLQTPSEAVA